MQKTIGAVAAAMLVLVLGVIPGSQSDVAGEQKKEPVRFKVLNTFETDLEGIDKAQLIQFEMDPGAEVKNFTIGSSEFLWVTKGVFAYTYGNKTVQRKRGETWFHSRGTVIDVANKAKGVAVLRGIQLLKKK